MTVPGASGWLLALIFATSEPPVLVRSFSGGGVGQANLDGRAVFIGNDGTSGDQLWISDGSAGGTQPLTALDGIAAQTFRAAGGRLFFDGISAGAGVELWGTNGTPAGTALVADIHPTGDSWPQQLTNVDGTLFFTAADGVHGRQLWRSDGTTAGTRLVVDLGPVAMIDELCAVGGRLFFTADDGTHGAELWSSDGTPEGTRLVADIFPGADGSSPDFLRAVAGQVYFRASDPEPGLGLWRSDGSAAGTVRVDSFPPGILGAATGFDGAYYCVIGGTLWRSAGSWLQQLPVPRPVVGWPTPAAGFLFFMADEGGANGWELWRTDGTAAGTLLLRDQVGDEGQLLGPVLREAGGALHFAACDLVAGCEPWVSDGTPGGTRLVADLRPGPFPSDPYEAFGAGPRVFFYATTPEHTRGLYAMRSSRDSPADFDGDGRSDLVWLASSGQLEGWPLEGTARSGRRSFVPATAPAGWRLAGSGAVAAGAPDLLWHNAASGKLVLWEMNGLARRQGSFLDTTVDPTWQAVGSGDFDRDGFGDLLWWRPAEGRLSALLLQGSTSRGLSEPTPSAAVDGQWLPVGTGDFDRDGDPDVLWRHRLSGRLAVWFFENLVRAGGALLVPDMPAGAGWQLAALADADADGFTDLVWRHPSSQRLALWLMTGTTRRLGYLLTPDTAPAPSALLLAPR